MSNTMPYDGGSSLNQKSELDTEAEKLKARSAKQFGLQKGI